ncbi:GTP-binding protein BRASSINAZOLE INSENSITIVE PALE GREEN 2, chloroplastic-like [Nicotiana tabacum]|uniref:GTP-binding protein BRASSINAZOLE INSENSITIVE PALE GREEN 2, chloroplastic-like n=1 Tax=Nicotiana tabacum TaxID=4097 RepID=A0A1S4A7Y9_TOBAC|nr:GTP-binding protein BRASSINAZOLE INSENSITIVE PALE GREEN 2, chloroplastic [Nicotiana tomentosiformis]XP_016472750.1 PREDICTED: GTP-binding protein BRASSINAZOLE INSENSITIVE PALE GREEN 2, chloroplastic-like [Nicotiana tabacum]
MALLLSTSTAAATSSSYLSLSCSTFETKNNFLVPQFHFTGLTNKKEGCRQKIIPYPMVLSAIKATQTQSKRRSDRSSSFSRKDSNLKLLLSQGRNNEDNICPGCGIFMQDDDPNLPGYFKKRKVEDSKIDIFGGEDVDDFLDNEDVIGDGGVKEEEEEFGDCIEGKLEESEGDEMGSGSEDGFDDWDSELEEEGDDLKELDGFMPAGLGYGNITEEVLEKGKKKRVSKAEKKRMAREAARGEKEEEVTVCARCHSLRNYGQVKNEMAENLIPDFDFDQLITTRLMRPTGNADATVVVMVVDCVDFDGSFPKRAAKSLFKALELSKDGLKQSKKLPKLVLVATKVDLLPSQVSPARLDKWVRHRAKANGAPKLSGVYMVSSRKDLGVRNLLAFVKDLAGPRGNVWVIGAQNAGKSTLINAFAKKEGVKATKLTEAAVPGTTLGILRIGGILSAKAKMYDTPGLLHPYLMSMRLNREEQKMVEIRKELQPRTYRIKQGQTVHIGGLVRLDLVHASVQTIYVTVWASPSVSLHLGKTENADELKNNHAGVRLQPPISMERVSELGQWQKQEVKASGISWDVNSIDIAVAGLGWFSLGLKGEADLMLWTYDGIQITLREPLVLDRAASIERPGFWLPKAISEAIANPSKLEGQARHENTSEKTMQLSEVSSD